ncbi:MAG: imidazolonepropionase [Gemmatimonadota bacterium]
MPLLRNIGLLATCRATGGQGDIHPIPNAALAWNGAVIQWVGPERELPSAFSREPVRDAGGQLLVPGLIDAHTHLGFGGWRAGEFQQRIQGTSYLEIAQAGGGILSTVRATRAATADELLQRCRGFLDEIVRLGITTVEAKSGYGLDVETENRLLHVYRQLKVEGPVDIVPTFLGAHTVPVEFREERAAYLDLLINLMIPEIGAEGLAEFCDVFVEETAFTVAEARRILGAARDAGMGLKLHADQLQSGGGAELAAEVMAASADHLEHASPGGIKAMAAAGVVAVSLPLASLYLRQSPMPAREFIDAGAAVAIATDFNPGSSPSYHLPLAMTLACIQQRMTPAEVLKGTTIYAARACGREAVAGSLEVGKRADFALIAAPDVEQWLYHFRPNACVLTVANGMVRWEA